MTDDPARAESDPERDGAPARVAELTSDRPFRLVYAALMSACMAATMSAVSLAITLGLRWEAFSAWPGRALTYWALAFPLVLGLAAPVRRLSTMIVRRWAKTTEGRS